MRLIAGCYLTSGARETNQQTQAEGRGPRRSAGPPATPRATAGPGGAGPAALPRGQGRKRIPLSNQERDDENDLGGKGEGENRV